MMITLVTMVTCRPLRFFSRENPIHYVHTTISVHQYFVTRFGKTYRGNAIEHVFMYKLIKINICINMYTEVIFYSAMESSMALVQVSLYSLLNAKY